MSQGQVPPSGSSKPSWRNAAPTGAADGTGGSTPAASSRAVKLVGLLLLLLALAGATAGLFLYLRGMQPPDFVSLAIREYKSPLLPPNALALQDSLILEKCFAAGTVERPYNVQDSEGILRVLRDLRKKGTRPVVIHICALARHHDGKVFLLGDDADLDRPETWVPLAEIVQKIRDCPAPAKLLILDVMRPGNDARFGLFADDIAGRVQAALAAEKELPFLVLLPCAANQSSLVCEELGQSLFAYYLDQGLRGYADGYGSDGKHDWRITVAELADYVKRHVDRLAWETHGVRQAPVLLGQGTDFPLVQFEEPIAATENPSPPTYPLWLRDGWAARDKLRSELTSLGPGILRNLDDVLLRAEQRWRAGIEEPRLKSDLESERNRLNGQVQRIAVARVPPLPRSLPENKKGTAALADAVRSLLPRAPDPGAKIDEKDKAKKEAWDKEIKGQQALLNKQPLDAAAALFEAAAATPKLGPAQVALLSQFLRELPRENDLSIGTRFAQSVFLERLRAFEGVVRNNDWDWPMPTVHQALRTAREAQRALAEIARDPGVVPWVADLMKNGDNLRRAGEKDLFTALPTEWPKADQELREAEAVYAKTQIHAQNVRKAREVRDSAFALFTNLAPVLAAQPKDNYAEAKAWKDAVLGARQLADALAKPAPVLAAAADGGALENLTSLGQYLDDLQRFFETKVRRSLAVDDDGLGENYEEIQALLENPGLDGPRRQALWTAGQKLALRLLARTQTLDKAEVPGQPAALATPGPDRGADRARQQKQLRFQETIDMISLAGLPDTGPLYKDLQAALTKGDEQTWLKLTAKLSQIWPRRLLAEFKAGATNLHKADRSGRVLAPFDLASVRSAEPGHWSQNPALALYRRDLAALWAWLGERYRAESAAQEANSPFRTIYREWAEEYAGLAVAMP